MVIDGVGAPVAEPLEVCACEEVADPDSVDVWLPDGVPLRESDWDAVIEPDGVDAWLPVDVPLEVRA